ncbi:hypothetical protein C7S15_0412 [Burkholderia cepacia]|nr:hypothetical protein [Burkholderia cepacia]
MGLIQYWEELLDQTLLLGLESTNPLLLDSDTLIERRQAVGDPFLLGR